MNYKAENREWRCDYCGEEYSQHWLYDRDSDKICCDNEKCRKRFKKEMKKDEN